MSSRNTVTLGKIKSAAKALQRQQPALSRMEALDQVARRHKFYNYQHAEKELSRKRTLSREQELRVRALMRHIRDYGFPDDWNYEEYGPDDAEELENLGLDTFDDETRRMVAEIFARGESVVYVLRAGEERFYAADDPACPGFAEIVLQAFEGEAVDVGHLTDEGVKEQMNAVAEETAHRYFDELESEPERPEGVYIAVMEIFPDAYDLEVELVYEAELSGCVMLSCPYDEAVRYRKDLVRLLKSRKVPVFDTYDEWEQAWLDMED